MEKIRQTLDKNACTGGLRLGVVGGGCSGLSYKFALESLPRPTDQVFEESGVKVFVDPKSYAYLDGLELDFTETFVEQRFVFNNPNAQKSCSCGKSFQPNEVQ